MTYSCPTCGTSNKTAYVMCNHPMCPDGRDQRPKLPELVVTKNGVPFEDQTKGLRQFKEAALRGAQYLQKPIAYVNRERIERFETASIGRQPSSYLDMPLYEKPVSEFTRRLYLDLDGVMANFDLHFHATFRAFPKEFPDQEMWDNINSHPSFFRDLPVMDGALDFFESIRLLNPIILTACPKTNYQNAARQKREWVREHLGADVMVLPVMGGHNKPLFMHAAGDILIDDWDRNVGEWSKAGGTAILHTSFDETCKALSEALIARNS